MVKTVDIQRFTDQDIISAYLSLAEKSPIYRNTRESNNVGMNVYMCNTNSPSYNVITVWSLSVLQYLVKFLNGRLGHEFKYHVTCAQNHIAVPLTNSLHRKVFLKLLSLTVSFSEVSSCHVAPFKSQ